jgi:hypothetical protein
VTEPKRPRPGSAADPGPAGSTSDAATETGVGDAVGSARTEPAASTGHNSHPRAVPPDVRDAWNADRTDVGPESVRGEERQQQPASADPFADVDDADVQADRTSYPRRSGM